MHKIVLSVTIHYDELYLDINDSLINRCGREIVFKNPHVAETAQKIRQAFSALQNPYQVSCTNLPNDGFELTLVSTDLVLAACLALKAMFIFAEIFPVMFLAKKWRGVARC